MDTAIITTRMVEFDAISNFTMASAVALKKMGKVSIYAFAYERPAMEGVDIHLMGCKNSHSIGTNLWALLNTFKLAREFSKYNVLLVVNPDAGSMPACQLAKKYNSKLKIMWTFHGLTPPEFLSTARDRLLMHVRKALYIYSMKRCDLIRTDSQYVKKELTHSGIDPSKITVMKLGVDLNKFYRSERQSVRAEYGIGDKFLILYVGRLVNFKHVDELIRAVSLLNNVYLIIVGGGLERQNLETLCTELHVQDRIKFAGRVPDSVLPDYYTACDVWATASRHEGFCVPIIEAMAAGKPVIVPSVAAMPETAGDAGLIYPAGDVASLAEKIRALSANKELYAKLSSIAKARTPSFEMSGVMEWYVEMVKEFYSPTKSYEMTKRQDR